MSKTIDYYLSLMSPWSYLGAERLSALAREQRARIRVRPIDLRIVFPASGGLPLVKRAPQRQSYRLAELARWRRRLGIPLNLQPRYYPAPEAQAACLVIAAELAGGDPLRLAQALQHAVWVEERNIAELATLEAVAEETGHHGLSLMAKAFDPDVRRLYRDYSQQALDAGVFGVPSYVVEGELFWGQDRLDFLAEKLAEHHAL
jgi:carboxymethylenebutenolidase